jgi:hypothetical protein
MKLSALFVTQRMAKDVMNKGTSPFRSKQERQPYFCVCRIRFNADPALNQAIWCSL